MDRISLPVRPDWREKVEARGLTWHTADDGKPYWDESAYWRFTAEEIDWIEAATNELYAMCLAAVDHAVTSRQLADFGYDAPTIALIEKSWAQREREPSFYARFDLAFDGADLKLLELNGDTPTSLVEAAVVQWWWLEERFPDLDQYNSIHEKLGAALALYARNSLQGQPLTFTCVTPHLEDEGTIEYLQAIALEAGVKAPFIALGDIGWDAMPNSSVGRFVDMADQPISALFKLVPWEWLLADPFGVSLAQEAMVGSIRVIEPAWKMVASNKRLLVTLMELYPDSEYLLDATTSRTEAEGWGEYVRKPVRGREGANVTIMSGTSTVASSRGDYGDDLFVYQRRANLAQANGNHAVVGSWVVNGEACGIGVRESVSPITNNLARFVPHLFEG